MKNFDLELSPEIKIVIENRRKKFLFSIYMLFIVLIISMTFKDIYYKNITNYTIEWIYLVFVVFGGILGNMFVKRFISSTCSVV